MKAGLLPLYVELYDERVPHLRPRLEKFYKKITGILESRGIEIVTSPFCRLACEFENSVKAFENTGVSCIITLHMAYSPSLECEKALCDTELPIIVMDTTETESFGFMQDPDEINYNHGIHGVMDMCSVMQRNGKRYAVCAGHYEDEAFIDRLCLYVKAAEAAKAFHGMTVGSAGGAFPGMGDFYVSEERLKEDFGINVVMLDKPMPAVKTGNVPDEMAGLDEKLCEVSMQAGLQLRQWLSSIGAGAFTVNFLEAGKLFATMPFMEICRCMADGIGYAGEGDVLTASLTGALMKGFGDTSFVEIFCPDWKDGRLFLSHMGEMNLALADRSSVSLFEKDFPYADAPTPIAYEGRFKEGRAVYVNLAPKKDGYTLFCRPVTMESCERDNFSHTVRGWMRPDMELEKFLEMHSEIGATHHSVIVYGADSEQIAFFGRLLGFDIK